MTKRKFQKIQTYKFTEKRGAELAGKVNTEKSSFTTLEKAIEDAYFWINKEEDWIDTEVIDVTIINKDTKEVLWTYTA